MTRISYLFVAAAAVLGAVVATPLTRRQNGLPIRPPSTVFEDKGDPATFAYCNSKIEKLPRNFVLFPISVFEGPNPVKCGDKVTIWVGGKNYIRDVKVVGATQYDPTPALRVSTPVWKRLIKDGQNPAVQGRTEWLRFVATWVIKDGGMMVSIRPELRANKKKDEENKKKDEENKKKDEENKRLDEENRKKAGENNA